MIKKNMLKFLCFSMFSLLFLTNNIKVNAFEIVTTSNIEEKTVELPIEKEEFINVPIIEVPNESIDNNYGVAKDDMSVVVCKFLNKE